MKTTSKKFATFLTVIIMVAFTSQSFSQLRESTRSSEYDNYVGNLQSGINSDNVGLKICAIQFSGLYKITENLPLLVSKYKEEKDPKIKNIIAISIFMLGDNEALAKIGLDDKSILKNISLSMLAEMYKLKSGIKTRTFETLSK